MVWYLHHLQCQRRLFQRSAIHTGPCRGYPVHNASKGMMDDGKKNTCYTKMDRPLICDVPDSTPTVLT